MRVLYIATSLNPPNGICAFNVADDLLRNGHNVLFYTQKKDEKYNRDSIFYSHCSNAYNKKEKVKNYKLKGFVNYIYKIWNVICYPIWPINSPFFVFSFVREAKKVAKENKIDIVISEYGDIASVLAGYCIKKSSPKIMYVAYFIDALLCGATPRFMKEDVKERKALFWEKRVLSNADGIVMMDAAYDVYFKRRDEICYFDKITFLDVPMLVFKDIADNKAFKTHDKIVRFSFVGSMPRNIREPKHILEVFEEINEDNWEISIAGGSDYSDQIEHAIGNNVNINKLGYVSHYDAMTIINESDFLINIGNSVSSMVPSKIFEYISSGIPIVSTKKIVDDSCDKYLSLFDHCLQLNEDNSVKDNAIKLKEFVSNNYGKRMNREEMEPLAFKGAPLYKNTPGAFVDYLEKLYENFCKEQ